MLQMMKEEVVQWVFIQVSWEDINHSQAPTFLSTLESLPFLSLSFHLPRGDEKWWG